jgi:phospholipid/cholesterol/gamma-HCH transport system ATP-binding protein
VIVKKRSDIPAFFSITTNTAILDFKTLFWKTVWFCGQPARFRFNGGTLVKPCDCEVAVMTEPLIEFKNVTKKFGGRTILDQVNLKIYEGEITTIIGKSGSGKSMLLKHLIGLLKPDEGCILFRGQPLERMRRQEWDQYLGQISYMFQNNALFDWLTVFENVALPLRENTRLSRDQVKARVTARLEQTELAEVAHKYPAELSGGMQKRTALARALVIDPKIVLFDELTTGQDPVRRNAILGMIVENKKKFGFTAILISHDIPDVFFISNRILALYDRQIVFQGTPEEFEKFEHPLTEEIKESLESLQDELTGLYSRRQFKVRYQSDLSRSNMHETYAVVLFTLIDPDAIIENLGHTALQQGIRTMGQYINKHFGAVGGFSARRSFHQFQTLLPFSTIEEAGQILETFTRDFQKKGLAEIEAAARAVKPEIDCFEFSIYAGLAKGQPDIELESITEIAEFRQKPIGRFQCEIRTEGPTDLN